MRKNYTETNRMSNTTKTEMVAEMKPGKTDKEDNTTEERRSLRSGRVNCKINEKATIKKKINDAESTITDKDGGRE